MSDVVSLQIAGQRIEDFESYDIEADLYQAADRFTLSLSGTAAAVTAGMPCKLYINGQLELTGLIDKVSRRGSKSGSTLTVEGRDLMGLLVDSHAEQFVTVQGQTVKQLAELLLAAVPFIQRSQVVYQENIVGKLKGKKKAADSPLTAFLDTPQRFSQIEPGMSVFEVLAVYAASRGLMFFCLPDGTLVFGRPRITGQPLFNVVNRRDGQGCNVTDWDESDDISRRYSRITVVSQVQGSNDLGAAAINAKHVVNDPTFPFAKPMVVRINNDSQTPALYGRMLLEKQKHDGYSLGYTAPLHSQAGRNWAINELCTVDDDVLGVQRTLLVFSRRFTKDKSGSRTLIKLGPPGLVVGP